MMLSEKNLHKYQKTGVQHIIDNEKCGLFLDMGLGKTVTTLTAVKKLIYEYFEISSVLVVAPKRVAETVWSSEIERWAHLKDLTISKIAGRTEKHRIEALKTKADIHIISRDNIAWLCGYYGGLKLPYDWLIIDESSSFKNSASARFKSLRKIFFHRVTILTGTPAPNTEMDLWAQIYLLDKGHRLGKFITHFRRNFFTPGDRNGSVIYNYNIDEPEKNKVQSLISDICMSMKAEDYLDMPDKIINDISLEMPSNIKKIYFDFEREKILELLDNSEDGITAANAAALSNKLLQFANGAVYDEDKNFHEFHDLKLQAIEEIVENANGQPVLIAWTFRHDLARLQKKLAKYNPVTLKGDKIQHIVDDWNDGLIQVLLMHPASGGHGLNLQSGGNIVVWFGQTWSLELYDQLNARLYRQGQDRSSVIINRLVVADTMDIDVTKSLEGKKKSQDSLMEAVKFRIEKYEI